MVRTLLKTSLREIRQSLGRYLAILAIVGLGVGFFAGLRTCQPAMMATGVKYLGEQRLYDFRMLSTLGFTREDVEAFAALEGVETAQGSVYADFLTEIDEGEESVLRAHSLTPGVNLPDLIAGRMPEAPDECVADARRFGEEYLGRTLTVLEDNDEDTRELLHCGEYTIVGLAWSPYYLNYERGTSSLGSGSVSGFLYIPEEGFDFEAYYEIFLTLADPSGAYSDEYQDQIDALKPSVENLTEERAEKRYTGLYDEAMEKIADAENEIADGWVTYHSERTDADDELRDAYQKLTDGEAEYQDGVADYKQGQRDYADGLVEYEDGAAELADARRELDEAEAELTDARAELDEAEAELTDAKRELDDGAVELADAKAELDEAEAELADAKRELDSGAVELADAKAELDEAEAELADAKRELDGGAIELADAKAELDDAEAELADAKRELDDAEAELRRARRQLDAAEAELAESGRPLAAAKAELDSAKRQLEASEVQLAAAKQELDVGKAELDASRAQLDEAKARLDAGTAEYNAGYEAFIGSIGGAENIEGAIAVDPVAAATWAALQAARAELDQAQAQYEAGEAAFAAGNAEYQAGLAQYEAGYAAYQTGLAQYNAGYAEYQQGLAQYNEGAAAYRQGLREYEEGRVKYEEGLKQYEEGWAEYEDGLRQYEEAQAEYQDGLRQYNEGWAEYQDGVRQYGEAQTEYEDGLRQYEEGWAEYQDGLRKYEEAQAEYEDGLRKYEEGRAEYEDGLAKYNDGWAEYQDGLAKYEDGVRELEDARKKLEDAKAGLDRAPGELAGARQELDDGWAEYNDGRAEADEEFAGAERELKEAEQELSDARKDLAELKPATTYTLTRQENTGYVCFDNDTSIIAAISVVFPVFFFLVAALVCMTTMTRMVDEQRTQTGVLKALGYSNRQIMGKYLFYSGSAALIGSTAGYALGTNGLPWIFWEIYGIIYGFAPLEHVFLPGLLAVSFAAALLCSMGATWLACRVELAKQPAELLRPKTPRAGRRVFLEYVTPLWRRLSFLYKVSVRNVLRYRSRLIMMVLGIGGCTALLATGFGVRDSIKHVADDQYDEITLYDYAVNFQEEQTPESAAAYLERSGWEPEPGLLVHSGSVDVLAGAASKSVYRVISSTGSLEGYLELHSGSTPIPYPGPGEVVLNVGLAENMGIALGDTIQLRDSELGTLDVTVSGIADNYVFNYVYVAAETYAQQLGQVPEYNSLYLHAHKDADPYAEGAALLEDGDVGSVTVVQATRDQVDNMLSRLDYVVVVVVVCAAALAFIVLYNLTNINITERIREIATIKVLGFYQNEVASYVFREILILSALGSLAGLLMGKALHAFVMSQIQIDSMFFACRIAPLSYFLSFCMTMLFSVAISLGMRPRLRRIDMAESLKSIE